MSTPDVAPVAWARWKFDKRAPVHFVAHPAGQWILHSEAKATVDALQARIDELEKAAARYRFIQPMFKVFSLNIDGQHTWQPTGQIGRMRGATFAQAIDAAINADKATQ